MVYDCVVIGGGPAGLNASLALGRGKKEVILLDDDAPRNAVTQESHNFITRDGVKPAEFREAAHADLKKYSNIVIQKDRVTNIDSAASPFRIHTETGKDYKAKTIILATGLKDVLPEIQGIHDFYGKSLFACPFCDGWELKDTPLVYIADGEFSFHGIKMISNWNKDIVVCTNGKESFSTEERDILAQKQFEVIDDEILRLQGENGQLKTILFKNGNELYKEAGFVSFKMEQAAPFAERLGLELNDMGGIKTDSQGRTSIKGIYAGGDTASGPPQLIIAASEGSKAAIGVISDFVEETF
ncbi:pyridine nucleotide-disulfide oxidoreductase [Oceanobacillus oncorhynchi subsp. incaldanensis]|uniref:NAD(P)/FAD-dependent oxidoreductase n=1 Tax=Oceanobacillus aidingensis TaxID=645964 RepID=A0ABV9JXX1_9BACI|nr:NAD(P)/FAD-dependent oxidoreductase [Oceanobacillus oncorhynchi]GIO17416.1 pyridine nucleotide-disulfide oxidoreductase [Oceanobacillus oncorhynchi subsp. incaldanensis]